MQTEAIAVPNPMSLIASALEKGVEPATLQHFMELQERYERNEAAKNYAAAISGFQSQCPMVFKTREVKNRDGAKMYSFANFEDIMKAIRDLLRAWGIAVSFTIDQNETMMKGTCRIRVGTHFEDCTLSVPIPKGMNTNATQDYGIAVSYLKRYLLCAALNIVVSGEDDDARKLVQKITPEQIEEINRLIELRKERKPNPPFNMELFLDWIRNATRCHIEDLSDIPVSHYERIINDMKRKAGLS